MNNEFYVDDKVINNDCCPSCGGDSGFCYTFAHRQQQLVDWNGVGFSCDTVSQTYKRGAVRCIDCNKILEPSKHFKIEIRPVD